MKISAGLALINGSIQAPMQARGKKSRRAIPSSRPSRCGGGALGSTSIAGELDVYALQPN
jgi:hypothetical protein